MIRTIKGKITVQTIAYILVMLLICETVSIFTLDSNMTSQSRLYIDAEAQNNAGIVNEWLVEQGNIAHTLTNALAFMNTKDTDTIMNYLEKNLSENEDALMYYLCFGYNGGVLPANHSSLDLDPTTRDWWKQAIAKNELVYTAPYKDFASGNMVVTIAEPLKIQGEQAVFLADITIDTLTKQVEKVSADENLQGFLLDADGAVVCHVNKDFQPKEEGSTILSEALDTDVRNVAELRDYDGRMKFVSTAGIDATGWIFGVTEDKSVITREIMQNLLIVVALGVILMIVVAFVTVLSVRKSLAPMETMKKFIKEKVIGTLNCNKQKDETAEIQYLIHELEDKFISVIRQTKDESGNIYERMQGANDKVASISENIMEIGASMEETGANIDSQTANIEKMNEACESASHSIMELADEAQKMASNARTVAERVDGMAQELLNGKENAMKIAAESRERMQNAMRGAEVIGEIGNVSSSIKEIAAQTNLLALNASIEAARAGEAGKGFAVVADEIRVLAEQSKAAVSHIQEVTGNVTAAVENLANDAERLLEFVGNDVVESLGGFAEMANSYNSDAANVDSLVTDFSASSEQLLASINGVMDAISDVSKTATEGATGTTDIAEKVGIVVQEAEAIKQKAETTYRSAEKLQKNVERFIV